MRFTQRFSMMSSDREIEEQNDKREKEAKMMKEGGREKSHERHRDTWLFRAKTLSARFAFPEGNNNNWSQQKKFKLYVSWACCISCAVYKVYK